MWPYGSLEPPLGEQAPTYADGLEAHWDALPFQRKARVLSYLAWRLLRVIPYALAAQLHAAIEATPFIVARVRRSAAALVDEIAWLTRPEQRQAFWIFLRSLPTFNAMMSVAPLIAFFLLLSMFTSTRVYWSMSHNPARLSVVEQARLARSMRPPPCYLTADGEIWIDAEGGPIRPGRRGYLRQRQEVCGF